MQVTDRELDLARSGNRMNISPAPRFGAHRELAMQVGRFILVGLLNTAVGLVLVYINIFVFGMGEIWGNFAGYVMGLLLAFSIHRNWTFRARNGLWSGGLKYVLAFAISYAMNLACVLGLRRLGVSVALAQAGGVVPYVVSFFLLSRYVVFAAPRRQ